MEVLLSTAEAGRGVDLDRVHGGPEGFGAQFTRCGHRSPTHGVVTGIPLETCEEHGFNHQVTCLSRQFPRELARESWFQDLDRHVTPGSWICNPLGPSETTGPE